jgi:DNA-binding transcriptional ArsR family regulator
MVSANMVEVAALVGDTARATMLAALMGGQSLTGTELAYAANITRSTASGHLAKLVNARLIVVNRKRRFAYYRIASPLVAAMLESIKQVAAIETPPRHRPRSARDDALCFARTCYDHLAGRLGVALADAMVASGQVELAKDGGLMTDTGMELLRKLGIDVDGPSRVSNRRGRVLCRPCLDWSERRPHLAGAVGAALCTLSFDKGWVRRIEGTRAVAITPNGQRSYRELFGVAPL